MREGERLALGETVLDRLAVDAALVLVGREAGMGLWYWAGLGAALLLVTYEFTIARTRDRDACFRAFLHNNWVGMVIFAGIAADLALRPSIAAA